MAQCGSDRRVDPVRAARRDRVLAEFPRHRQDDALPPVDRDRREAQRRARHRGGRDVAGHLDHRRRGDPQLTRAMTQAAGVRAPAVPRPVEVALLASVFIVAACGLVYELAAGALASYVLGDSVLQFSTVIGAYLFAMGLGSYLSRWFERQLIAHFLRIELLVGLIGGLMPAALFALHTAAAPSFRVALYALVLSV